MDARALLIYQYLISCGLQIFQDQVVVVHKLTLGNKFDPLDHDVDVPSLKENVVPLVGLDHFEHEAHIQLLILWYLVVFLYFAKHAHNRQQGILFKL